MLAHQFQRERPYGDWNLDRNRRPCGIPREEYFHTELGFWTLARNQHMVRDLHPVAYANIPRSCVVQLDGVCRAEKHLLRRSHTSLSHLASRKVHECQRVAPAHGNVEI